MAMKMQGSTVGFVDGLYAKFYALPSVLLRVGSKCSSGFLQEHDSFHPAEAVAGIDKANSLSCEMLIVPAPRAADRERILGFRSPQSPW
jgi:hypothetical protein